jgi:hypothetical protein
MPEALGSSPSWFTTPGCKVINCSKLRLLISSSRIWTPEMVPAWPLVSVST